MSIITGEYSERGYTVFQNNEPVYSAGNHVGDSAAYVQPGSAGAVPSRQLRVFCIRTCREMAAEKNARFGGVERL